MKQERQSKIAQVHAASQALEVDVARLSRRLDDLGGAAASSPQQIRKLIRARQSRGRLLGQHLFADPAWDILLEAYAGDLERKPVAVSALCNASGVPESTALRWIGTLEDEGLLVRREDTRVELSPMGSTALTNLLSSVWSALLPL